MGTNGNSTIILPGQRSPQQGMSAAQREEERLALRNHVDILTLHVNEVTKACEALIQAQRQNETLIADLTRQATALTDDSREHAHRIMQGEVSNTTLTDALAGTNLQLSQALDRLTALDSHEDRIDVAERTLRDTAELADSLVLSTMQAHARLERNLAACERRLDKDEQAVAAKLNVFETSFMARLRWFFLGR